MANIRHPRRGSLQYWPRKRARHFIARVRSWAPYPKAKPLGFLGFKVGMTHILVMDNRPKSPTKGETVSLPTTIVECPPVTVAGIATYKQTSMGWQKVGMTLAKNLSLELGRTIQLPKNPSSSVDMVKDFDDLRLIIHSNPHLTSIGSKKPVLVEVALGGTKEEKLQFAQNIIGKELAIADIFEEGTSTDVHAITKGKGFQGTVKRFGVPIRQHKAEKTKRGIGTLGSWTPKRVPFTVAQSGKMGYHLRTESNKQILKIGKSGEDVNPSGGFIKYGLVGNHYILLHGSIPGPKKRAVFITHSIRPRNNLVKEVPPITYISRL